MARPPLNDLAAFVAVARERSFTRAASQLGLSPSALSHAIRSLEARLGVRLLTRTTRSVTSTEAGERMLIALGPALDAVDVAIAAARSSRDTPAGTVRITAVKHAVTSVVMPALPAFMARYPDIHIEIDADDGLADIVASGYDAGIRFGGSVEKDMVAVAVSADTRAAIVASPAYLSRSSPLVQPDDLTVHRCIVHRRPAGNGVYPWPFEEKGRAYRLRIAGPLAFNDSSLVLDAAVAGHGVACVFEDLAAPHVAAGRLVQVLTRWACRLPRYDLYYPYGRQNPPALAAFVEWMRARHRNDREVGSHSSAQS